MIHIIGTSHSLQVWTDAKRNGESLDADLETVKAFERDLASVAKSLKADLIAEEANEDWVAAHGHGASSVAKGVAQQLGIEHLFCEPDPGHRRAAGLKDADDLFTHAMALSKETGRVLADSFHAEVKSGFAFRELVWLQRLEARSPNKRLIIFVCGADHVDTFSAALESRQILAVVERRDWTQGA